MAAASVAASRRFLPMYPATPVIADPTTLTARRREGVMTAPRTAEMGTAAYPPTLNNVGDFRAVWMVLSPSLASSLSSSIPPASVASMESVVV